MIIPIDKNNRISTDEHQWKIETLAGTDSEGHPRWRGRGHYSSLESAIKGLYQLILRTSDAEGIAEVMVAAEKALSSLSHALAPDIEVRTK